MKNILRPVTILTALFAVFAFAANCLAQASAADIKKSKDLVTQAYTEFTAADYKNAFKDLDKAISLDPKNAGAYSLRANCWLANKDYEKTIADNTKAIELDPTSGIEYLGRGTAYQWLNRFDDAVDDYQRGLDVRPANQVLVNYASEKINAISYDNMRDVLNRRIDQLDAADGLMDTLARTMAGNVTSHADSATSCRTLDATVAAFGAKKKALHRLVFIKQYQNAGMDNAKKYIADEEASVTAGETAIKNLKEGLKCGINGPASEPSATVTASLTSIVLLDQCFAPSFSPTTCKPTATKVALTTTAKDFGGGNLSYNTVVTGGTVNGKGANAIWELSGVADGTYLAIVTVSDDQQHTASATVAVTVVHCGCLSCPTVSAHSPAEVDEDQPFTFTAEAVNADIVTYNWSLSAGVISSGQGTPTITVDPKGMGSRSITATVEFGGFLPACRSWAISTTHMKAAPAGKPSATELYNSANEKHNSGDLDGALVDFTRSIEIDPKNPLAYYDRGETRYQKNDFDGAIADFTKAIENDPIFALAYFDRGKTRQAKNDLDGAIADLSKTIELDPKFTTAYYDRGTARYAKKDFDGAVADFDKFTDLEPKDPTGYNALGSATKNKGDIDHAIAYFSQAILLDPKYAAAYYNRGLARFDKKDYDGAIADHTKAIECDPKDPAAYYDRGNARDQKKDADGAIADYTKAIELDPAYRNAWFRRGADLFDKQGPDAAIADYTKAIEIDPQFDLAYYVRGVARDYKKDHDGAIADFTRAIEINPRKANYYRERAGAYRSLKKIPLAESDEKKANALEKNN